MLAAGDLGSRRCSRSRNLQSHRQPSTLSCTRMSCLISTGLANQRDALGYCATRKTANIPVLSEIMAAPDNTHDFVGMIRRMSTMNERFLANHPRVDRSSLPFINVHDKLFNKAQVGTHLHKRLSQCASVGAAFLALHKTGTHCLRRGGARMWLNILPARGGEAYLRWLGCWRSSARLVYPEVTVEFKQRAAAIRADHMRTALHHLSP